MESAAALLEIELDIENPTQLIGLAFSLASGLVGSCAERWSCVKARMSKSNFFFMLFKF
jgi:hypothetical protein